MGSGAPHDQGMDPPHRLQTQAGWRLQANCPARQCAQGLGAPETRTSSGMGSKTLIKLLLGGRGTARDRAGWEHNLYDEAALGQGDLTASFFGDIEKFYDNVSHHILWEESQAVGFPPALKQPMLAMYEGPR